MSGWVCKWRSTRVSVPAMSAAKTTPLRPTPQLSSKTPGGKGWLVGVSYNWCPSRGSRGGGGGVLGSTIWPGGCQAPPNCSVRGGGRQTSKSLRWCDPQRNTSNMRHGNFFLKHSARAPASTKPQVERWRHAGSWTQEHAAGGPKRSHRQSTKGNRGGGMAKNYKEPRKILL